jgi:NlpC/P60 family putative phage cell wall peptidase
MDDARAAIVAEARRWIGTPYRHQASVRGAGCDCLGLVRGLWRWAHGDEPLSVPPYSSDWAEAGRDEALWRALKGVFDPARPALEPGQILLFRMRAGSVAKHLGVLSDPGPAPHFIHAYSGHGVVESPLSPSWARRIVARFDLI